MVDEMFIDEAMHNDAEEDLENFLDDPTRCETCEKIIRGEIYSDVENVHFCLKCWHEWTSHELNEENKKLKGQIEKANERLEKTDETKSSLMNVLDCLIEVKKILKSEQEGQ